MEAPTFNQNLNSLNVSRGTTFVSFGHIIQFDALCALVWLCFQVGFRVKFITDTLLLKKQVHSTNHVFFFVCVRGLCFIRPLPSIKTSVAGMSPVVPPL
jgi:hypothetical protein